MSLPGAGDGETRLTAQGYKSFLSDGNVLELDCGSDYTTVYVNHTHQTIHLKMDEFYVYTLELNKTDFKNGSRYRVSHQRQVERCTGNCVAVGKGEELEQIMKLTYCIRFDYNRTSHCGGLKKSPLLRNLLVHIHLCISFPSSLLAGPLMLFLTTS